MTVKFRNVARLIGKEIPKDTIYEILNSLDIATKGTGDSFIATVPAYRSDVTREADIIEEILRIYGFNNVEIPEHDSAAFISEFPLLAIIYLFN